MTSSELIVELLHDWEKRGASEDYVLANAEELEEAIGMAIDEYRTQLERTDATEPWDA